MSVILAVDDVPLFTALVRHILEEAGHSVVTANNGAEGLALVGSVRPDLILLDVMMPGLSGLEVYAALQERESTRGIPVIFLTALSDPRYMADALDNGAYDYIAKPFSSLVLRARVEAILRRRAGGR